eukprot:CAMPEP_0202400910 /NCGR_PEP_ID=MMETSP1128-20130828/3093_1 /ASSEMBLY_ACC=CAM_ASM_000463 /TAXON_ID=3047 /ORGANISM="Dunaliella tertiolecta, Strain CCMP1320" /LENGTH=806 /DNA_ID=CAMNT_0049004591 /DNA_START=78 /DNA_END=2498 /DNA_ORIENTATION=-
MLLASGPVSKLKGHARPEEAERAEEAAVDALLGVEKSWGPTQWPSEELPQTPPALPPTSKANEQHKQHNTPAKTSHQPQHQLTNTAPTHVSGTAHTPGSWQQQQQQQEQLGINPAPHRAVVQGSKAQGPQGSPSEVKEGKDAREVSSAGVSTDESKVPRPKASARKPAAPFCAPLVYSAAPSGAPPGPILEVVPAPTSPKCPKHPSSTKHQHQQHEGQVSPQHSPCRHPQQQHPHPSSTTSHTWLTPPELSGRRPPPIQNASSAELEPSVVSLSSPKTPAAFLAGSKKPTSLSQSLPTPPAASPTLQLSQAAALRASLPSRKTATVNMRDPVNMLLDHYHIASALDDHNSALVAWHAQRLEKYKATKGGNGAGGSPGHSPAGAGRKSSHCSNGWDAFQNEPIGTYISNPEYSFAGSQPLKSERTGGVLYERHTSSDASLPPVQRCYLRARNRQQLLVQLQQQQQQQQGQQQGQGRQSSLVRADQTADALSTAPKKSLDRPLSRSAQALPNGIPLSRLDYMHAMESSRVASALHRRAAVQQAGTPREEFRNSPGSRSAPTRAFHDPHPHSSPSSRPRTRTTSAAPAHRPERLHPPQQPAQSKVQEQYQAQARPSSGVLVEGGPGTERSSGALSNGRTDSRKVQQQQQQQQHLGSSGDAPLGPGDDLPQKGVDAGALGGEVAVSGSTAQNLRKGNSKGDRSIKEVGGDQAAGEPGKDSERRGTGAGRGGAGLGYGSLLLHNGEAASEVFGGARTLRAGTAEPVLDESFYKTVHQHFLNLTGQQTAELQGDLNVSLPEIIESFGISSTS